MINKVENFSMALSVGTGTYAIANIQDILSIIILVLSIINILWTMCFRIYTHIKEKRYEQISQEIENAKEELNNLKEEE